MHVDAENLTIFADFILMKPTFIQTERMLAEFTDVCGNISVQMKMTKTNEARMSLGCPSVAQREEYFRIDGEEVNIMNDLATELRRMKREA